MGSTQKASIAGQSELEGKHAVASATPSQSITPDRTSISGSLDCLSFRHRQLGNEGLRDGLPYNHERRPSDHTRDANGIEPVESRSCDHSDRDLYNGIRPHQHLENHMVPPKLGPEDDCVRRSRATSTRGTALWLDSTDPRRKARQHRTTRVSAGEVRPEALKSDPTVSFACDRPFETKISPRRGPIAPRYRLQSSTSRLGRCGHPTLRTGHQRLEQLKLP